MNKYLPYILVIVTILFGFTYFFNNSDSLFKKENKPMLVAKYYWPGMYWVDIAYSKGWFNEEGLDIELVDTNDDYYGSINNLTKGTLHTQNIWLFDLMQLNSKGENLEMVVNADSSTGAEALVVESNINDFSDLKEKKVGVETGTALDFLIYTLLKDKSLSIEDINIVKGGTEDLSKQFANGELDAVLTWYPLTEEALKRENSKILWDTSKRPGIISAGYVFKKSYIEENPEKIQKFVNVWNKTSMYIENNPEEAYKIIAKIYNDTLENVEFFTNLNNPLTINENFISFSYYGGVSSLYGQAELINRYFNTQENISQVNIEPYLNSDFIRKESTYK